MSLVKKLITKIKEKNLKECLLFKIDRHIIDLAKHEHGNKVVILLIEVNSFLILFRN